MLIAIESTLEYNKYPLEWIEWKCNDLAIRILMDRFITERNIEEMRDYIW